MCLIEVKKTLTEEEADAVRAKNEEIRKARDVAAEEIANKFACFKRDFMGAPIWSAMKAIQNGTEPPKPCQIDYRKNEKYWVFPDKKDVSVTFEVQFSSIEDISLGRIFLLELNDSKRQVQNAPAVQYHDKTNPENVMRVFPNGMKEKTSNGSITFKVADTHLKKGLEGPLSQIIGFRQYLHFHVHAIKI